MILLLITSFIVCQIRGDPIVGGKTDQMYKQLHSWMVSIQTDSKHFCGGTIISKSVILTAAHCALKHPPYTLSVWVGSSRLEFGGWRHIIDKIKLHENHSDPSIYVNDVALIKVLPFFKLEVGMKTIQLASKGHAVVPGTHASIFGWGRTSEKGANSNALMTAISRVVDTDECKEAYQNTKYESWFPNLDAKLCTAMPGSSDCYGDSGGPLVVDGIQVGIISWALGCARPQYPAVIANVAFYRDWIEENTKLLESLKVDLSEYVKRIFRVRHA